MMLSKVFTPTGDFLNQISDAGLSITARYRGPVNRNSAGRFDI